MLYTFVTATPAEATGSSRAHRLPPPPSARRLRALVVRDSAAPSRLHLALQEHHRAPVDARAAHSAAPPLRRRGPFRPRAAEPSSFPRARSRLRARVVQGLAGAFAFPGSLRRDLHAGGFPSSPARGREKGTSLGFAREEEAKILKNSDDSMTRKEEYFQMYRYITINNK